ncbi:hypothetical protein [Mycoplasma suis]|uniref:Uncharacterized protein n=1 Tax=Mycoplasma suis (strain Illinois) TaxID=768700 RepID=F0QQI9_MYCSL|nr:hypothetical protein [Mycoplasma suis]ADX97759.1 hypothetical protein MSU_0215 [Mycoplasma suis str. Illinois]
MFRVLSGYGWSLIAGGVSVMALGSYGAISLLGGSNKGLSIEDWYKSDVQNNEKISFARYVAKEAREGEKSICGQWKDGRSELIDYRECERLVKEKWNNELEASQPEVWLESNKEVIDEVISSYFKNEFSNTTIEKTLKGWKVGSLECIRENFSDVENRVQVNCNYEKNTRSDVSYSLLLQGVS